MTAESYEARLVRAGLTEADIERALVSYAANPEREDAWEASVSDDDIRARLAADPLASPPLGLVTDTATKGTTDGEG